ncbi:MAG: amino acid permease, partial [Rhizobiales bacterium 32-66-8]
ILNLGLSSLAFVLLPFEELVKLNSSAIVLSFIVGPVAVVALRHLLADARRPLKLPRVQLIAGAAFIISTLIVFWSGWPTVWRLGVCLLIGVVLFLTNSRTRLAHGMDLAEAAWLPPYFAGLGAFSYLGTFGGIGLIGFGWDIALIAVFSLVMFRFAVRCRLSPEKFAVQIAEERAKEIADSGRTVDAL